MVYKPCPATQWNVKWFIRGLLALLSACPGLRRCALVLVSRNFAGKPVNADGGILDQPDPYRALKPPPRTWRLRIDFNHTTTFLICQQKNTTAAAKKTSLHGFFSVSGKWWNQGNCTSG